MHYNQPATAAHKVFECRTSFGRPSGSAVAKVTDDNRIVGKCWLEVGIFSVRCMRDNIDGEETRILQIFFHHLRCLRPVTVIVLAIDDEGFERLGGSSQLGKSEANSQNKC